MTRPPFPTPYAGAYYPIFGNGGDAYRPPATSFPFDKISTLFLAFAHAYPLDRTDWRKGAELRFEEGQPDQAGRVRQVMDIARHVNPRIQFIISLGWGKNDWSYISADYVFGAHKFADSVVKMIRDYGFNGFDIDDEDIGNDPADCQSSSGCIKQPDFDGVIAKLRSAFDAMGTTPPFLTITPAGGSGHVTKENVANFDLINPQCYGGSYPRDFPDALPKQLSWGISTETPNVVYPSPSDFQNLAGIFNWSMAADNNRHGFRYTMRIAQDVHYPPEG